MCKMDIYPIVTRLNRVPNIVFVKRQNENNFEFSCAKNRTELSQHAYAWRSV